MPALPPLFKPARSFQIGGHAGVSWSTGSLSLLRLELRAALVGARCNSVLLSIVRERAPVVPRLGRVRFLRFYLRAYRDRSRRMKRLRILHRYRQANRPKPIETDRNRHRPAGFDSRRLHHFPFSFSQDPKRRQESWPHRDHAHRREADGLGRILPGAGDSHATLLRRYGDTPARPHAHAASARTVRGRNGGPAALNTTWWRISVSEFRRAIAGHLGARGR